ncbi:MAG: hypothetical protein JWL77_5822 [Chthonomonadaceae bacterium]|nr:hypothetical protein [Chthonomonadaceae bacterium]
MVSSAAHNRVTAIRKPVELVILHQQRGKVMQLQEHRNAAALLSGSA